MRRGSGELRELPSPHAKHGGEGLGVGGILEASQRPHPNPPRRSLRSRGEGTRGARGALAPPPPFLLFANSSYILARKTCADAMLSWDDFRYVKAIADTRSLA